jgi:hypothetical protein
VVDDGIIPFLSGGAGEAEDSDEENKDGSGDPVLRKTTTLVFNK